MFPFVCLFERSTKLGINLKSKAKEIPTQISKCMDLDE